jgi:hypothetical protein
MKLLVSFLCERDRKGSMTRLCALVACIAGCVVAIRNPDAWQTVTACLGGTTVALLTRKNAESAS